MVPVERFFQFSLLGLITSGFFALAGTGLSRPPDADSDVCWVCWFAPRWSRGFCVSRSRREVVSLTALGYVAFFPIDFYFISHDFLATTVHGVCFLATVKILTGALESRLRLYRRRSLSSN